MIQGPDIFLVAVVGALVGGIPVAAVAYGVLKQQVKHLSDTDAKQETKIKGIQDRMITSDQCVNCHLVSKAEHENLASANAHVFADISEIKSSIKKIENDIRDLFVAGAARDKRDGV